MNVGPQLPLLLLVLALLSISFRSSGGEWRDRWMGEMDRILETPVENQIERLSVAARARSTTGAWKPRGEQIEVADRAISILVTIPGHSEFHRDRILAAQKEYLADRTSIQAGSKSNRYYGAIREGCGTLAHLPSVETMRVFSELIENDRVPPGNDELPVEDRETPPSLFILGAVSQLPLVKKPSRIDGSNTSAEEMREHLPIWRQWFQEIKDGKRTFRFEGDPMEYDLDGPAPKETLERIALAAKRDTEREVGRRDAPRNEGAAASGSGKGSPASVGALLAAAVALIASFVWYFLKRRKRLAAR